MTSAHRYSTARLRRAATLVAGCVTLAATARAQEMRSLHVSRGMPATPDTSALSVDLTYGVGSLTLQRATTPVLYAMTLDYRGGRVTPVADYRAATRTLVVGIRNSSYDHLDADSGGDMTLALAPRIPLDLHLKVGAATTKLQLSGLAVRHMTLETGATTTTLRFDSVNSIHMDDLQLRAGAAELTATGLANARTSHVGVAGGAGVIDLSFDGQWTSDIYVNAKVAFGKVILRVPPGVTVISTGRAILGEIDDGNGDRHSASTHADSSDDDSDSMNDDSDSSDVDTDSLAAALKSVAAAVKITRAHAKTVDSLGRATGHAAQRAAPASPAPQATDGPHYTLHVSGSATLGSIEVVHSLKP